MTAMRTFTAAELARFNGTGGSPPYVAHAGLVYDLSKSFTWQLGRHHAEHVAGTDLTEAMAGAPHGASLLGRFPVVGRLVEDADREPPGA
jgi:predicted heme/steroid binding protein